MRMTALNVRTLGEDDWQIYRDVRLSALEESPEAFAASSSAEKQLDESAWRRRMARARRILATDENGDKVGVVSLRSDVRDDEESPYGELFGLWVTPDARGTGVAVALLEAVLEQARKENLGAVIYWVGTDNARGVAFASSRGFLPTEHRRPMNPNSSDTESEEEAAFVYPVGADETSIPSDVLDARH